jgi:hypothetical protein
MARELNRSASLSGLKSAHALKVVLAARIVAALERQGLTVREAHAMTGQAATDFSRLRGGQLERFTVERLLNPSRSDIDLAVKFARSRHYGPADQYFKFKAALEQLLGGADAIARTLAVRRTDVTGARRNMPLAGRALDGGRYLIVAGSVDHPAFARGRLAALSNVAPVTLCEVEEHVMWSSVARWERGRKIWSVAHRGEESPLDLQTAGQVPGEFTTLKSEVFAMQEAEGGATAGIDLIFDLPIEFARRQTRLHPDDALFDEPAFEQLGG